MLGFKAYSWKVKVIPGCPGNCVWRPGGHGLVQHANRFVRCLNIDGKGAGGSGEFTHGKGVSYRGEHGQ